MSRVLIVGAGLYGATVAHRLNVAGHDVLVVERRDHVAGNAYTRWNEQAACHEHVYGAHIFHTNNAAVMAWVSQFAALAPYRHIVRAKVRGTLYPFPINLQTLHQVFGVTTPEQAAAAIAMDTVPCDEVGNMEQHCRATIGNRLYEMFIEGYTAKQWNCEPRSLPVSIIRRIPVRLHHDDTYFSDNWQGIPVGGYTPMVERMLAGIKVALNTDFEGARAEMGRFDLVVYTGGIDQFFDHTLGRLGYRSLTFNTEMIDEDSAQGVTVINHCDRDVPWTRTIEHRHFLGFDHEKTGHTLLTTEYPSDVGEPFYPINTGANQRLLGRYRKLAAEHYPQVVFGGRLGEYRYLDMHQVIASALAKSRELAERLR